MRFLGSRFVGFRLSCCLEGGEAVRVESTYPRYEANRCGVKLSKEEVRRFGVFLSGLRIKFD